MQKSWALVPTDTSIPRTRNDYPNLECGSLDDGCRGIIFFGSCPGFKQVCDNFRCRCAGAVTVVDERFSGWECGPGFDGCNGTIDFGTCTGLNATCLNHRCKDDSFKASMWRLVCEAGTVGRWWVKDIEFHAEGMCKSHKGMENVNQLWHILVGVSRIKCL